MPLAHLGGAMRRMLRVGTLGLVVLLSAGTALGQVWRLGVALGGQVSPFGLTGFFEYQQGACGVQARVGWDLFGDLYLGGRGLLGADREEPLRARTGY